jgi:hypothetical protein
MPRRCRDASKLSVDLWGQVGAHLFENPRRIFMLLCSIRDLKFNEDWWEMYWRKHKAHVERKGRYPHWYLKLTPTRPGLHKTILKLVYGRICTVCGCRYHHTIFVPFNMRVCSECLRDKHISNVVLWHEYGLDLEDIALRYRQFIRFHKLRRYNCPKEIYHLTRHPLDIGFQGKRMMIFFWKPDLENLYNFQTLRQEQVQRVSALNLIKAVIKRCWVQKTNKRYLVEYLHSNEVMRLARPMYLPTALVGTKKNSTRRSTVTLELYFHVQGPLPLLADDEYNYKTAISKLKLNASTLAEKICEWRQESDISTKKIFKIK